MELKGKKVLVTGADGFIGSHLVEGLISAGCKVTAFVFYNSFNSWGWLDTFSRETLKKIDVVPGDVRDPHAVREAMKGQDIVFHLAALIGIPYSYHSPDMYVDTNVKGTVNVLQAAKDLKTKKVLVTSTSEVYGTALRVPIDETHPRQGQSPYSATKIAADAITEAFYCSYNLPVTIVRPFNTYGPRQSARAIIPTIITQLLTGKKEIQLGALDPVRDFVFVKDTVAGFLAIARSEKVIGQEINVALQTEISVEKLAKEIIRKINPKAKIVSDQSRFRPAKSEVTRLLGDSTKLRTLTDWKPCYSHEQGLDETIAWFKKKENLLRYKTDIYNL